MDNMVQIGNFHIGSTTTAEKPAISVSEAYLIWEKLLKRYDMVHLTKLWQSNIHDADFRIFVTKILKRFQKEANDLEPILTAHKIPLPPRPPESTSLPSNFQVIEDRFIFRRIFTAIQDFLDAHIQIIASLVTNDTARGLCISFLISELDTFDDLAKFGKLKGWLQTPPVYKP